MKYINRIIDNKDLVVGETYVYISTGNETKVLRHEKAKFQNEQHEKDYLSSQGPIYMMKDLEKGIFFDLNKLDYLESRYKIFPLDKENLGFILNEWEIKPKKTQNLVLKHFKLKYNL